MSKTGSMLFMFIWIAITVWLFSKAYHNAAIGDNGDLAIDIAAAAFCLTMAFHQWKEFTAKE